MHAVFFEVRPKPGHLPHYFDHVDRLKPVLARHTGLAFLDRYTALREADVLLSHQLWDSEEAISAWRADSLHRRSQAAGQQVHFADYRIRVGARVLHWQSGHPEASVAAGTGTEAPHVVALYGTEAVDAPGVSVFESVNHPGRFITLTATEGLAAAGAMLARHRGIPGLAEAAAYCIRRDYGQFDRTQAPAAIEAGSRTMDPGPDGALGG